MIPEESKLGPKSVMSTSQYSDFVSEFKKSQKRLENSLIKEE